MHIKVELLNVRVQNADTKSLFFKSKSKNIIHIMRQLQLLCRNALW